MRQLIRKVVVGKIWSIELIARLNCAERNCGPGKQGKSLSLSWFGVVGDGLAI